MLGVSDAALSLVGVFLTALIGGCTAIIVAVISKSSSHAKEAVKVAKASGEAATSLAAIGLEHLTSSIGPVNGHGTLQEQMAVLIERDKLQAKDTVESAARQGQISDKLEAVQKSQSALINRVDSMHEDILAKYLERGIRLELLESRVTTIEEDCC